MKTKLLLALILESALSNHLWAQGNYVVNTSNNSTQGTFNTIIGPGAGASWNLTGDRNTMTGTNAGNSLTWGNKNSFYGVDAGRLTTVGVENTFIGFEAGLYNTSGSYNSTIGRGAGYSLTTGSNNSFTGYSTGFSTTTGAGNSFLGAGAGQSNTTGNLNSFLGYLTGYANTTGANNTFIGAGAGYLNSTSSGNSFIGIDAGNSNTSGNSNTYIGIRAGYTGSTGNNNTLIGDSAGFNNTNSANVFVGSKAGYSNKNSTLNTYLGFQTGYNAVADSNTFIGYNAGYQNTSGFSNIFVGVSAGQNISTGSHNTIIGNQAGPTSINTNDNVYLGYNTGQHDIGSQNTLIGTHTDALTTSENPLHNATAIGFGAIVAVSNAVVLGQNANVGIGTSAPTTRLHIRSEQLNESGIRLENLTNQSTAALYTDKFLSVNERGNVMLAQYRLKYAHPEEWADRVFATGYILRPLAEVRQYVLAHAHLPGIPSAQEVVKEGLDPAQLNAKLLEKIEELTLYLLAQQEQILDQRKQITTLQIANRRIWQQIKRKAHSDM